ncbi:ABC transporter permease subunit [Streptomyces clavifer]|uniref:ABC transporter permease subunit n=1 Tax=Streptomyces TaxID=1883 RepID=UPI0006F29780|nr:MULTISPECIES: ABC transporter permease subunit [unclassified Streptomyces]KQX80991.1 transporter [Streptomyces sp. Root1319]KQZ07038.1 transporter [Streptomyces sp. Root55]
MSTTPTGTPAARTTRPRLLRGLSWLVLRQHRTTLICLAALALLGSLWIVYQRGRLIGLLDTAGWPEQDVALPVVGQQYSYLTLLLGSLPGVLAVFLGAPLIAADSEQGTAQLVTTQSVTRRRWLIAKLGWCFLITLAVCTTLSAFFTWWWTPYRSVLSDQWMDGTVFDNTGPVLPALALFLTAAGVTIGALLRRVLASMVVTFAFCVAAQVAWDVSREYLAPARRLTYPLDEELPARLSDAYELDSWIATADGQLYGWGTCVEATEKASAACIADKGIVSNVYEYLDYSQMAAMQWTAAGILLAGTALLTAFVLWRSSRRPL